MFPAPNACAPGMKHSPMMESRMMGSNEEPMMRSEVEVDTRIGRREEKEKKETRRARKEKERTNSADQKDKGHAKTFFRHQLVNLLYPPMVEKMIEGYIACPRRMMHIRYTDHAFHDPCKSKDTVSSSP